MLVPIAKMVREIDETYWGRYEGQNAEARVHARKVFFTVTGLPTISLDVAGFDKSAERAVFKGEGGSYMDFTTVQSMLGNKNPVKMATSGQHSQQDRMHMREEYKDGEPPSPVIPIILVVGVNEF